VQRRGSVSGGHCNGLCFNWVLPSL
jgi:hypothetical protein